MLKTLSSIALISILVLGCAAVSPEAQVAKLAHDPAAPVSISDFSPRMNSVGGISVEITFINPTRNTYKYVNMMFSAHNAVGDAVSSSIGGAMRRGTQSIGPFPFGGGESNSRYGPLWYNSSITCIVLQQVEIVRMDNSKEIFDFERSKTLVAQGKNVRCR